MWFFEPSHPNRQFAAGVACVGVVSVVLFLLRDDSLPAVTALLALVIIWLGLVPVFLYLRQTREERPPFPLTPLSGLFYAAFFASNARPPHAFTVNSIASLLTGRPVERIKQLPHDGIGIYFKGEEQQQLLNRLSTVFSDSFRLGANISAFGQIGYSYCRLFHTLISQCWNVDGWWKGKDDNVLTRMGTIARQGWQQVDRLIQGRNRFVNANLNHIERFKRLIQDLAATASDPRFHLVYAHLRMPHEPFIYNRFKDTYDPGADPDIGYLDNLELTDGVLAEVWKGMEAAGLWDATAVIISADHSWRTANKYDGKFGAAFRFREETDASTSWRRSPVDNVIFPGSTTLPDARQNDGRR